MATIIGIARTLPDTRTFVVPVLIDENGETVSQRIDDRGMIIEFERMELAEEFRPVSSRVRVVKGGAAVFAFEIDCDSYLLGTGPELAKALSSRAVSRSMHDATGKAVERFVASMRQGGVGGDAGFLLRCAPGNLSEHAAARHRTRTFDSSHRPSRIGRSVSMAAGISMLAIALWVPITLVGIVRDVHIAEESVKHVHEEKRTPTDIERGVSEIPPEQTSIPPGGVVASTTESKDQSTAPVVKSHVGTDPLEVERAITEADPEMPRMVMRAGPGEWNEVILSDGSAVTIAPRSSVEVQHSQRLRLLHVSQGEALFVVAKDASRPFIVTTDVSLSEAIGTEFAVRTLDGGAVITVAEGEVIVRKMPISSGEEIVLSANQEVIVQHGQPMSSRDVDASQTLSWAEGKLVLRGQSVAEAVAEFNRRNEAQLEVDPHAAEVKLYGAFNLKDPDQFERTLQRMYGERMVRQKERLP